MTLSGPPLRRASSISRSAVACGSGSLQRLGEGLLADHAGQPVGAEQVAVAGAGLAHREVGLDVLAVERAQQQRALRVAVGLLRR